MHPESRPATAELQFSLRDVLKIPPVSQYGNVAEIIGNVARPSSAARSSTVPVLPSETPVNQRASLASGTTALRQRTPPPFIMHRESQPADGELQFTLPNVLKVPPISNHGNVAEIIAKFGGTDQLRNAVDQLQMLLYAA